MKKLIVVLVMLCTSFTFAAKPKFVKAEIQPAAAKPGDAVKLVVEFSGNAQKIEKLKITVREYAYDTDPFYLEEPDQENPNIWSLETEVPYDAPSGTIHLEIKAMDKKGREIVTKEYKNQTWGRTGLVKFTIQ